LQVHLARILDQDLSAVAGTQDLPASLAGQKFPPLFVVEAEYRLALIKAELAFVNELVRRIVEDGWGPLDLWRNVQAAAAETHESREQEQTAPEP
jgi:hypothetical protein